jgi:ribulose-5-phosphate 4-epimerase/fuculose-1-phosphate aldolase
MDQEDMEMHRKLKFAVIAAFCWAVSFSLPAALLAQRTETEESLKVKVAEAVRMLAVEGIVNYSGHVSARVPGTNRILINSRDASREIVQSENIVTVDLDGNKVAGKEGEPDETWMHLAIYRARPDVMSVVHSHALYSTSFTIARKPMLPVTVRGAIFADGVPEYPEAGKIVNREQGDRLAEALGPHRAALLRMHGAVVVGAYLEEAFAATIQFEENAQYQLTASMLGPVDRLTPQEVEDSVRESWKPNSILKRWEYYRAKEIRANPGLQEEKLQSSAR